MLTLAAMQKILFEKDHDKRHKIIQDLPEKEVERLLAEAAQLAEESRRLIETYRK